VKTVSSEVVRHFTLTIRAKMIGGDPFYLKFWIKLTVLEQNRWFSISFCS